MQQNREVKTNIYRHIDVCLNRVGEGLRVIDEILRFYFDDSSLFKEMKQVRHQSRKFFEIDEIELLRSRNSIDDPGFSFNTKSEGTRKSVLQILKASFKRVIESLRILEEYSKLTFIESNVNIEAVRQKMYDIEKKAILEYVELYGEND